MRSAWRCRISRTSFTWADLADARSRFSNQDLTATDRLDLIRSGTTSERAGSQHERALAGAPHPARRRGSPPTTPRNPRKVCPGSGAGFAKCRLGKERPRLSQVFSFSRPRTQQAADDGGADDDRGPSLGLMTRLHLCTVLLRSDHPCDTQKKCVDVLVVHDHEHTIDDKDDNKSAPNHHEITCKERPRRRGRLREVRANAK